MVHSPDSICRKCKIISRPWTSKFTPFHSVESVFFPVWVNAHLLLSHTWSLPGSRCWDVGCSESWQLPSSLISPDILEMREVPLLTCRFQTGHWWMELKSSCRGPQTFSHQDPQTGTNLVTDSFWWDFVQQTVTEACWFADVSWYNAWSPCGLSPWTKSCFSHFWCGRAWLAKYLQPRSKMFFWILNLVVFIYFCFYI